MYATQPYLELRERLSQIWINRYTLLLMLCMVKILLFTSSLRFSLNNSKVHVLEECSNIEHYYNILRNGTPHYMGKMGNYLVAHALEATVESLLALLTSLATVVEVVAHFMIELWLGTYACLLFSAAHGAVEVATNVTEKVIGVANKTLIAAANELDNGLDGLSKVLNKIIETGTKVSHLFKDDDEEHASPEGQFKKINLTIASLRTVKIPESVNDKLRSLAEKTPDFEDVKNKTKGLVSIPFQTLKNEINGINATSMLKNRKLMSVPPIDMGDAADGVCSANRDGIESVYRNLNSALIYSLVATAVSLAIVALLCLIPAAWHEYRQWERLSALRDHERTVDCKDPFADTHSSASASTASSTRCDVIQNYQGVFHRAPTLIGEWVARHTAHTQEGALRIQWLLAYVLSPRALVPLALGLAGVLVCGCQFLIIHALRIQLASTSTRDSLQRLETDTAGLVAHDLSRWADSTNAYINGTEASVNAGLLGWVTTATTALNTTVAALLADIDSTVDRAFADTPLHRPMVTVVSCVIGNKLRAIEAGLTWTHDHVRIALPRIHTARLRDAVAEPDLPTHPAYTAVLQSLSDRLRHSVDRVLHQCCAAVRIELYVSLALLGLWILQTPLGLAMLLFKSHCRRRNLRRRVP
ncbi:AFR685Cp [Eremothecium gossypii ATCC 10895]|uniref:Plasma membrane fusion protein PRM1 n=1 Tax=Eremothecium gossypii (strain ATCC 10895 / CBS 109.51 / FGSC 9923 / NRRL Y-1056) TaxID=284811 RepID=PRM1_EREGS|nr:AFR685Cp [Eremothecium gossypii ATCC 10895]Q751Z0.1 RecName: Full=Plasma membrane fusion protein PRM1 [Eremothecium gossypii ATCC 10895]AAS54057.1 AFR685Cp [Eremothecium gossypii ATCC 10895]AEY98372.1 FAFR685Cp [Eremothecium gossypii FDAG1]